jgi:hypothetical protein
MKTYRIHFKFLDTGEKGITRGIYLFEDAVTAVIDFNKHNRGIVFSVEPSEKSKQEQP